MCTDQYIHSSFFQIRQCFLLLRCCTETTEKIHPHRKILHPLHKGIIMLLCQNRGRHQIYHLLIFLYGLKGSANGNLCFTESYVSTDQPVHNLRTFHILFRIGNCLKLIVRLFKTEHLFKFSLPYRIRSVHKSLLLLSCSIELHQILCHNLHCLVHPCLSLIPFLSSKLIQLWRLRIGPCILLNHIRLSCQHIQIASSAVLNLHVVFGNFVHFNLLYSTIDPESVTFVNDKISHFQICKALYLLSFISMMLLPLFLLPAEHITLCQHRKSNQRIFIPMVKISFCHQNLSRQNLTVSVCRIEAVQFILLKILCQAHGSRSGWG